MSKPISKELSFHNSGNNCGTTRNLKKWAKLVLLSEVNYENTCFVIIEGHLPFITKFLEEVNLGLQLSVCAHIFGDLAVEAARASSSPCACMQLRM